MSTVVLLLLTGLGLGALYFLVAAGLSLIFGLADVLNFAHGIFLAAGAYGTWWAASHVPGAGPSGLGFVLAVAFGVLAGTVLAVLVELVLIRPLYARPVQQVLVTVGLSLAGVALLRAWWGADPLTFPRPPWTRGTTRALGATVPNDRFLLLFAALLVLGALLLLLRRTRLGLVIRAGVEDRSMVTALGIDVRIAFTAVFAIGGAAAALAGALAGVYFGNVSPGQGTSLLIFAFIVVVIGGMGSITGSALAAVLVGLVQQFANYYTVSGVGEASVVLLLAVLLLVRPRGLVGEDRVKRVLWLLPIVVLAVVPYSTVDVPGLLPGALNSPGSLQLLALCLLFAGFALSYDLLFGHTGLLSFGHALYVAIGTYTTNIAISRWGWSFGAALAFTAVVGLVLPALLGALALRVNGIAFAMVTLAFAEVGSIVVLSDPGGLTGGEEGLSLAADRIPGMLVGVVHTANLYWLALAYAVAVAVVVRWAVDSEPGRVWAAIRENERRAEVLGLDPYRFRLLAYVLSALLATAGGVVHLLLLSGSTPQTTISSFTLGLLVMVVLGGAGSRWGALLGGVLYTYADHRLSGLSTSDTLAALPDAVRAPLSEPQFVLGLLFIVAVYFLPRGIAGGLPPGLRDRLLRRRAER